MSELFWYIMLLLVLVGFALWFTRDDYYDE